MKFRIGQPVWAIGHCSLTWKAAVILGLYGHGACRCVDCGNMRIGVVYQIDLLDGTPLPPGIHWPHWAAHESYLRPRDEGQHEPASDNFDWRMPVKETA